MMAVGLSVGVWDDPIEKDLESHRIPVGLFFDIDFDPTWFKFRFGATANEATLSFNEYGKSWQYEMISRSLHLAYRISGRFYDDFIFFAHTGLAFMQSELHDRNAETKIQDEGTGYIVGGGCVYSMDDFDFGIQAQAIVVESEFEEIILTSGSNQLSVIGTYKF